MTHSDSGKRPHVEGGRERRAVASKGTPRTASSHKKLGKRHGMDSLPESSEECGPADTLVSGF